MTIRFGPFALDTASRQLSREGVHVHLPPKAFDLLAVLVAAAPRVVPKGELHQRLWPRRVVSDATLAWLVKEVRRALSDFDRDAPVIRTAHRVGYAFTLPVVSSESQQPKVSHWMVIGRRNVPLRNGEHLIGRDASAAIWLDYPTVSRRHAILLVDGAVARLEDCGSKNGTRIGGQCVSRATQLNDGDQLRFGRVSVTYRSSTAGLSTETQVGASELHDAALPRKD